MGLKGTARACLATTSLIAVSVLTAACGSAAQSGTTVGSSKVAKPAGSWPYPNGDLANTRDAAGSGISSANVASLRQAWTAQRPGNTAQAARGRPRWSAVMAR